MTNALRRKGSLFPFGPLWDEFLGTGLQAVGANKLGHAPALDVYEDEDGITLSMELPGMDRDDIDVSLENGTLSISGERKADHDTKAEGFHIRERRFGRFHRQMSIPNTVDAHAAKASFDKGVLTIKLPKSEQLKPKRLAID